MDDIISLLAHATLDGEQLTDAEIIDFLRLLLPAGAETTYRSSSILLLALLDHPDQLAALTADRSLMPQAIEEGLRWDAPLTGISRIATEDVTLDGVDIPAGTPLNLCLGAANRDPARHERPDEFDIFRKQRPHMAFGFGNHICLGMHLARMETVVAMDALLDRLPGLRWDPDAEPVLVEGMVFRAPPRLPVVWAESLAAGPLPSRSGATSRASRRSAGSSLARRSPPPNSNPRGDCTWGSVGCRTSPSACATWTARSRSTATSSG